MIMATGRVKDGKIVVEEGIFAEGTEVTVLAPEEGAFTLTEAEEDELLEAIDEAERGNVVDGYELLKELKKAD